MTQFSCCSFAGKIDDGARGSHPVPWPVPVPSSLHPPPQPLMPFQSFHRQPPRLLLRHRQPVSASQSSLGPTSPVPDPSHPSPVSHSPADSRACRSHRPPAASPSSRSVSAALTVLPSTVRAVSSPAAPLVFCHRAPSYPPVVSSSPNPVVSPVVTGLSAVYHYAPV